MFQFTCRNPLKGSLVTLTIFGFECLTINNNIPIFFLIFHWVLLSFDHGPNNEEFRLTWRFISSNIFNLVAKLFNKVLDDMGLFVPCPLFFFKNITSWDKKFDGLSMTFNTSQFFEGCYGLVNGLNISEHWIMIFI